MPAMPRSLWTPLEFERLAGCLAVIHVHHRKSNTTDALSSVMGSRAFTGVVGAVLYIGA